MTPEIRRTLSVKEAARLLGVSTRKVYSLIAAGELEGYNVGRKKVLFADSIPSYQERNRFGGCQLPSKSTGQDGPPIRAVLRGKGVKPGLRHLHL
jgi:excisionase family DNA binding protein